MKKLRNLFFARKESSDRRVESKIDNVSGPQSRFRSTISMQEVVSLAPSGGFRFVALDVETANSNNFSICQIGLACVRYDNSMEMCSQLVFTDEAFADFNVGIHGIDEETIKSSPSFPDVIENLRSVLEAHTIIQHSNFDKQAMDLACHFHELPKLNTSWLDSVKISRRAWPEFIGNGGHGLANLKTELDLKFRHHDAAEDARAAAEVVLLAEKKLGKNFDQIANESSKTKSYPKSVAIEGNQSGALYGQVACFTGALSISREEVSAMAAREGITVKSGVSKKLTMLVVGDQDLELLAGHSKSSKHRKAEELIAQGNELRIIGEKEFLLLINE